MTISAANLLAHEWIGLEVTIAESSDPRLSGVSGSIINETRNTLVIANHGRNVKVAKICNSFTIALPSGKKVTVAGSSLTYRPEDRVKRGIARW